VANDDGTILVVRGVLGVTTEHNISCQKTNLSSHLNEVFFGSASTEGLDTSVMLVQERYSEGNDRLGCSISNGGNSSLLSVTTREGCGSNGDVLTDLPVKLGLACSVSQSD